MTGDHRQATLAIIAGLLTSALPVAACLDGEERSSVTFYGGDLTFALQVDLTGDGRDEVVVGLGALGSDKIAEFVAPGEVYVYAKADSGAPDARLAEAFRCRDVVPEALLPGFFEASVVAVADVDADSLTEVILVWLEQYWWPEAYRFLAVLQFDPTMGTYEMVIDVNRYVCEIGGYAAEDVDNDGRIEIIEIDPVYGTEVDLATGREELECHFCPHQYELRVFEFDGELLLPDAAFNEGRSFATPKKFQPALTGTVISPFLPQLMNYVCELMTEE